MKLYQHYLIAAGLVLAAALPAVAQSNLTITQKGRRFIPLTTQMNSGQTLTFNNLDEFIHQIYVEKIGFDSAEQRPGQNVSVAFPAKGTFEVKCHIHPKMKLVVQVN